MKQKNGRQNYDWDKIKLDYMSDPKMSLKKIAVKYDIRRQTVEKRSKADNWFAEKQQYQKSLAAEVTERVYATQTDLLEQELRAVNILSDILLDALQDPKQFHRHIVRTSTGSQEERIFDILNTKAMLNVMKAVKLMVEIKRSILGIPSIEHQERMEIARAKLQLDRERLVFDKEKSSFGKNDEQHQIGIVILPEVKDESPEEAERRAEILKGWCS